MNPANPAAANPTTVAAAPLSLMVLVGAPIEVEEDLLEMIETVL